MHFLLGDYTGEKQVLSSFSGQFPFLIVDCFHFMSQSSDQFNQIE